MQMLIILILGLVLLPHASALKCQECKDKVCTEDKDCGAGLDNCFTETTGEKVVKGCVAKADCTGTKTGCCTTNLCNKEKDTAEATSGAVRSAVSLLLLVGPMVPVALIV